MKALWQSFLDPDNHRPYIDALGAQLRRAAPQVDFDVVGIRPPDRHLHALTELRCGIVALRNALYADRSGYDAVVIGHFQEPFLDEMRMSVSIPIVGLGEAALKTTHGLVGLIAIDDVFIPWHLMQARRLGIEDRVVGVQALAIAPDGFMAAMAPGEPRQRLSDAVRRAAEPLVRAGAETLIPAGALTPVALGTEGEVSIDGIPLMNPVMTAARAVSASRPIAGFIPPPREALEEFLDATGGPLTEPVR